MMKNKPDDRRDNVDKIQENINNTVENFRLAEETMEQTDNPATIKDIKAKNRRREEALNNMRHEIKDEAEAYEKGYED
jgi:small acid-soluble spore protein (thioredoxin-like protein)